MDIPRTTDIPRAATSIHQGRLVAFPTGTSYGLAADVTQGYALQRLRQLKHRPTDKTFTVFMKPSLYTEYLNLTQQEEEIIQAMQNKPLTLIVKAKQPISHLALDGTTGLRIIDHPLMEQLASAVDIPLTATSANISGKSPCFSPEDIQANFSPKLDETTYNLSIAYILDGGKLSQQQPTTIARIQENETKIIRQGAITKEELNKKKTS